MATKHFKKDIDSIPAESATALADSAYKSAYELIKSFRAEGSASFVNDKL